MKEQLVSFETAKLAKEKGFDWGVTSHYRNGEMYNKELIHGGTPYNMNSLDEQKLWNTNLYSAPNQSLLQKWLREKYKLHISVADLGLYMWSFMIIELSVDGTQGKGGDLGKKNYKTYEEALEAGLQETLKFIKP